jgi:phage/plasmid-like protein (TIGR03299 family)
MSHELDFSTGRAAIALRGGSASAWHGFGETIEPTDDLDTIVRKAGLEWGVVKAVLSYDWTGSEGVVKRMDWSGVNATVRTDTGEALGKVSTGRYHIVQPREVVDFYRAFLSDNGLSIETAGALKGGKIVWALANLGPDFAHIMDGQDKTQGYVRLQTSFDGSRVTSLTPTTIRQVCANTEAMIEGTSDGKQFRVAHTSAFDDAAKSDLASAFGLMGEQFKVTVDYWNTLAAKRVTDQEARDFFLELLEIDPADVEGLDSNGKPRMSGKMRGALQALAAGFKRGPGAGLVSANGTAYGLLNAVTYYTDHAATVRDTALDGESMARIASSWYGTGAGLKERARAILTDRFLKVAA